MNRKEWFLSLDFFKNQKLKRTVSFIPPGVKSQHTNCISPFFALICKSTHSSLSKTLAADPPHGKS